MIDFKTLSCAALLCAGSALAQAPADFAWRGPLEVPAGASVVRAELPVQALLNLQSPQGADVRVFDATGRALPFAFAAPVDQPPAARQPTADFAALPLYSAQPGRRPEAGSVQVNISQGGEQRAVWVRMRPDGADAPADRKLPSALFDTRASRQTIDAITVKAQLPPNTPVRIAVSESTDLSQWTPVPVRGRVFRFEGPGAPVNETLELGRPLALEGRYLRLDWTGQDGVSVSAIQGLQVRPARAPRQVSALLPDAREDGQAAIEWRLGFGLPMAALALTTTQPNTLVPVRVLGRNHMADPWRVIASTVVYRIDGPDGPSTNLPVTLPRVPLRTLRVEATHGMRLQGLGLTATAVFDPLEIVFVAGGSGPFEVAAGRAHTEAAALPLGMIAATTTAKLDTLPVARVGAGTVSAPAARAGWARWLPEAIEPKAAVLWAVLIAGVALLGGVAWSLLRQLGHKPSAEES